MLRSRRRAISEDDIETLLLCFVGVVGIDVKFKERILERFGMRKYIGGQRYEEQLRFGKVKNAVQLCYCE